MGSFEISNGELRNLTSLRSACESCIVAEESIPKSASSAWATEMSSASRAAAAARSSDRERLGGHTMSKSLTRSIAGAADAFGQEVIFREVAHFSHMSDPVFAISQN